MTRIGMGYDVHQLTEGRDLWLGGIKIEHSMGLLGHSDADVLIHAICDALLGAANMRDIGYHFPDTAEETDGIDSKILLRKTMELIRGKGYELGNIDCTVCAEFLSGLYPRIKYSNNRHKRLHDRFKHRTIYCPATKYLAH